MLESFQKLALVGLLGKVWPAERTVIALRTCKWLKVEGVPLLMDVHLQELDCESLSDEVAAQCILKFRCSKLTLVAKKVLPEHPHQGRLIAALCIAKAASPDLAFLVNLDLSESRPQSEEALRQLSSIIRNASNLKSLSLRRNDLGAEGATILGPSLEWVSQLQHLDLSSNSLCDDGVAAMMSFLKSNHALTWLDITANACSTMTASMLAQHKSACTALTHLSIGQNQFGDASTEHLAECLLNCSRLKHLDLGVTNSSAAGDRQVQRGVGHCTALSHLKLQRCAVTLDLSGWTRTLATLSSLSLLSLRGCFLQEEHTPHLNAAISCLPSLTHLDLAENILRDAAGSLTAVTSCVRLSVVDLSSNGIGRGETRYQPNVGGLIAALRSTWAGVKDLRLNNNRINDAGAVQLAPHVAACSALTCLDLAGNEFHCYGATKLAQAAAQAPALTALDMSRNAELALGTLMELQGYGGKVETGFR